MVRLQSQRPIKVSSNPPKEVSDENLSLTLMKDFFSKKSVPKPEPKPKTQFGGAAWCPWAQAPPNWFWALALALALTSLKKRPIRNETN